MGTAHVVVVVISNEFTRIVCVFVSGRTWALPVMGRAHDRRRLVQQWVVKLADRLCRLEPSPATRCRLASAACPRPQVPRSEFVAGYKAMRQEFVRGGMCVDVSSFVVRLECSDLGTPTDGFLGQRRAFALAVVIFHTRMGRPFEACCLAIVIAATVVALLSA